MSRQAGVQHRLAAIFCADVAGYTRLMHNEERGTFGLLTSYRDITDRQIEHHGGRIANTAGDSILAEFQSAVASVRCALAIQERIAAANAELPEERRVTFRIGVHVGEAMVRHGDLFGDGVNVAARLQSLAPPGAICLSGTVFDLVRRVLPLQFEDLGPQRVKNLDVPVQAYLTTPAQAPGPRPLPAVHRSNEFYLARRFQAICSSTVTAIAREHGLKGLDLPILGTIDEAPGLPSRLIAERAAASPVAVAQRLTLLIGRGLALRNASGGLELTDEGRALRRELRAAFVPAQDRVMAALSESEREVLRDLLTRVIKASASSAP